MDCAKWNAWLGRNMFVGVLASLAIGFNLSVTDSTVLRNALIALFGYATFITSLETSIRQFGRVLGRPWVSLWILLLVHIVTPAVAWSVGYLFFPGDEHVRLGYLICATIPVGVTSVIWTSINNGNVVVSLVTLMMDTILVPVLLPAFFLVAVGAALTIDYREMAFQLLWMITIPSVAGMIIHDLSGGKAVGFAKGLGGLTSKFAFYIVIVINAAMVAPVIVWSFSVLKMLLVTLFMVVIGYCIGYAGSFAVPGRPRGITVAMVYNVGLRNISAGLVLALSHFPPAVAVPMTLFILYQQPLASLVPFALKRLGAEPEKENNE